MYKYFAFISYSHADVTYARNLQEKMEFYGLGAVLYEIKKKHIKHDKIMAKMLDKKSEDKSVAFYIKCPGDRLLNDIFDYVKNSIKSKLMRFKIKMYPMCRDELEFSPSNDLKSIIFKHIDVSRKLILICSEDSINKDWVKEELEYFIKTRKGRVKDIIFVNISNDSKFISTLKEFIKKYYKDDTEPLIVSGREKSSYLEIISGLLEVDKSVVFDREKKRIKKRIARIALVTLVAISTFSWLFCGSIINSKIEEALKIENLSKSISLLFDAERIASSSLHDDEQIISALESVIDFDCGQVLNFKRFDNNYYNSAYAINEDGKLYCYTTRDNNSDEIVFDSNTGKEFARYNHNTGTFSYFGYNDQNKVIKGISAAQGSILKIENNYVYLYTNNFNDYRLCLINFTFWF